MKYCCLVLLCLLSLFNQTAQSEITNVQPLSFGSIVLLDNNASSSLSVDRFGNVSLSNSIRIISPPQHAIFTVTDLPANSNLPIDVSVTNPEMNPGRAYDETFTFSVSGSDTTVRANQLGEGTIRIGGTITTSGSGISLVGDATYSSQFRVTINF